MTGGWAATNTLREALTSDGAYSRYYRGQTQWDQFSAEVGKERDALALVEAALDAAQPMANLPYPLSADERQQWLTRQGALAAALRAVREGK